MAKTYGLWFRKTYQLAPTDPRYLDATQDDIEAEFWAYHFDSKTTGEEFSDEDFNLDRVLHEIDEEGEASAAVPPDPSPVDDWEDVPDA